MSLELDPRANTNISPMSKVSFEEHNLNLQQGKSEGFESCDRPIVRKRPIWVKICDVLYRVTLKFDGLPLLFQALCNIS